MTDPWIELQKMMAVLFHSNLHKERPQHLFLVCRIQAQQVCKIEQTKSDCCHTHELLVLILVLAQPNQSE